MKTLLNYAQNRYSQNGEDGILAEIYKRLGIKKGWFVEFGAWDAKHMSNTYALLEDGWSGVDIEGEPDRYLDLVKAAKKFPKRLYTIEAFVDVKGKNSLDNLLKPTPLPKDFDLLSIDIDSYDLIIWESFTKYNPKVVVIEINSGFAPGIQQVQRMGKARMAQGSSFTSTVEVGKTKGYTLVCHTGNLIFVRNDLVGKLGLSRKELDDPEALFLWDWVKHSKWAEFSWRLNRWLTPKDSWFDWSK